MKELFEGAVLEIFLFGSSDVITVSGGYKNDLEGAEHPFN